ncbi:uncharacterized protein LOC100200043 [Hydra vulgaris]|uniref:Uncharacterized protein LOC100200043 n=1 Tax=Hydra vulgaris TaxID=6087 RepID=A0ABM4BDX8_HYDVU
MSDEVCILHSGNESNIILMLKNSFKVARSRITFEIIDIKTNQQVEAIVAIALRDYKERKMDLIIIISLAFLNTIWVTGYKTRILNDILNYPSENVLHIWAEDVDEQIMRMYSTHLCQTHLGFRRVLVKDLKYSSPTEVAEKIENKLYEQRSSVWRQDKKAAYYALDEDFFPLDIKKSTLKLKELGVINLHNIAVKLNQGYWKKLAILLRLNLIEIQLLEKETFPADKMLEDLIENKPLFTLENLIDLLNKLNLTEIVTYIQKVVLL